MDDTIYAVSSGQGRAGVTVIRLSGPLVPALLALMCSDKLQPRYASLRAIRHPSSGDILDNGLVLWFPAPHSFTGEHVAEFHVHGGPAVVAAVLSAVASVEGTRMADAGEFSRRGFYNDKLDLTGIEAIADLIDAETEAQRQQAVRQLRGGLSDLLDKWRDKLVHILAYVEAGIDFSDEEDVPEDVSSATLANITALRDVIVSYLDDNRSGERIRDGLQVVIAGPPNAGKSSLLNILARRDVAIVSDQAGTTRDVIEVHLDLNGFPVTIFDTAGLRDIDNVVEEEGVRRAVVRLESADVVMWMTDGSLDEIACDYNLDPNCQLIRIRNKSDLDSSVVPAAPLSQSDSASNLHAISAKTGFGIDGLIKEISTIAEQSLFVEDRVVVTRARHREALGRVIDCLSDIIRQPFLADELIAEGLRVAARELGRITGRVDVEDLLDVIFHDFCVGK